MTKYTAKFRKNPQAACRREAAWGSCRASAAGTGPAAHHGAHCRPCACGSHGADPRCPVPQMVDQLQDITRFFDSLLPVPEQVIEVPLCALFCVIRSWWNSWWKCRLVSPSLPVDAKEAGRTWFQVSGPRDRWWWLSGSRHTQCDHPEVYTARPGPYKNTGLG